MSHTPEIAEKETDESESRQVAFLERKVHETKDPYEIVAAERKLRDLREAKGRRKDLGLSQDTLVIKVIIAGSGYDKWFTQVAKSDLTRKDDPEDEKVVTEFTKGRLGEQVLSFAGPGGSSTKGGEQYLFGTKDSGSNSIAELVNQVPGLVKETIATEEKQLGKLPIVILIKAHNRGAVAASQVAAQLKSEIDGAEGGVGDVRSGAGPGPRRGARR